MPARLKGVVSRWSTAFATWSTKRRANCSAACSTSRRCKKAIEDRDLIKSADVRAVVRRSHRLTRLAEGRQPGRIPDDDEDEGRCGRRNSDRRFQEGVTKQRNADEEVGDLKSRSTTPEGRERDLKAKLAKSEKDRRDAQKLPQDIADGAVAKGYVKAVAKTDGNGVETEDEPLAKAKAASRPTSTPKCARRSRKPAVAGSGSLRPRVGAGAVPKFRSISPLFSLPHLRISTP
jgi:hypothetical protein